MCTKLPQVFQELLLYFGASLKNQGRFLASMLPGVSESPEVMRNPPVTAPPSTGNARRNIVLCAVGPFSATSTLSGLSLSLLCVISKCLGAFHANFNVTDVQLPFV